MIRVHCPYSYSHSKVRRQVHMITSNAIQQQQKLCVLYAYQYSRRPDNKVSNDRRVCAVLLWRYTLQRRSATLIQVVAAHMQLDLLLFMKCCVGVDNYKILLQSVNTCIFFLLSGQQRICVITASYCKGLYLSFLLICELVGIGINDTMRKFFH